MFETFSRCSIDFYGVIHNTVLRNVECFHFCYYNNLNILPNRLVTIKKIFVMMKITDNLRKFEIKPKSNNRSDIEAQRS